MLQHSVIDIARRGKNSALHVQAIVIVRGCHASLISLLPPSPYLLENNFIQFSRGARKSSEADSNYRKRPSHAHVLRWDVTSFRCGKQHDSFSTCVHRALRGTWHCAIREIRDIAWFKVSLCARWQFESVHPSVSTRVNAIASGSNTEILRNRKHRFDGVR